jgi:hypothetical protein
MKVAMGNDATVARRGPASGRGSQNAESWKTQTRAQRAQKTTGKRKESPKKTKNRRKENKKLERKPISTPRLGHQVNN